MTAGFYSPDSQAGPTHGGPTRDREATPPMQSNQCADFGSDPVAGVGLGLRSCHFAELAAGEGDVAWLEALADNYAHTAGPARRRLLALRDRYPMVLHGVGLSLGSTDPIDHDYLSAIAGLARDVEPDWISEHLAWVSVGGRHHHELLPLPFIDESIETLAAHIRITQDVLGRRILVENSAAYVAFAGSQMSEIEFVRSVLEAADCGLLLDVNNLYVNSRNHGFDPLVYLDGIPADRVGQMHLGGHDDHGDLLIDAHGSAVAEPVWELFAEAVAHFPGVAVAIEWDRDVPPFEVLLAERDRAQTLIGSIDFEERRSARRAP
jgi:uncharacterized protein (UPF0276 family)